MGCTYFRREWTFRRQQPDYPNLPPGPGRGRCSRRNRARSDAGGCFGRPFHKWWISLEGRSLFLKRDDGRFDGIRSRVVAGGRRASVWCGPAAVCSAARRGVNDAAKRRFSGPHRWPPAVRVTQLDWEGAVPEGSVEFSVDGRRRCWPANIFAATLACRDPRASLFFLPVPA